MSVSERWVNVFHEIAKIRPISLRQPRILKAAYHIWSNEEESWLCHRPPPSLAFAKRDHLSSDLNLNRDHLPIYTHNVIQPKWYENTPYRCRSPTRSIRSANITCQTDQNKLFARLACRWAMVTRLVANPALYYHTVVLQDGGSNKSLEIKLTGKDG